MFWTQNRLVWGYTSFSATLEYSHDLMANKKADTVSSPIALDSSVVLSHLN